MKYKLYILIFLLFFVFIALIGFNQSVNKSVNNNAKKTNIFMNKPEEKEQWVFKSVDTMKYSRDIAREKLKDETFDKTIAMQVKNIADTGATHVAIATPYEEEFYPFLQRWVKEARRNKLKVWFRGNWSGWEEWFDYPKITRSEHISKTEEFILKHEDIFEDGDVFSPCPECENGGPGDPRQNGDTDGHRKFLIDEYNVTKKAFEKIGKKVESNYASMNGDVARLIMDRETTAAMDGIVVIDHYVKTAFQLTNDATDLAEQSGGKIILGEFGAPILDINGDMTEEEQEIWLEENLTELAKNKSVIGLSYWVNVGGSTELWDDTGKPRKAVKTLRKFYSK